MNFLRPVEVGCAQTEIRQCRGGRRTNCSKGGDKQDVQHEIRCSGNPSTYCKEARLFLNGNPDRGNLSRSEEDNAQYSNHDDVRRWPIRLGRGQLE